MTDGTQSSTAGDAASNAAALQDLLARCIDAIAETGELTSAEPVIAGSGALATSLRERLGKLLRAGLLPVSEGPATTAPTHPERLGDFRLLRPLGRGGMGVVYLAEQESLGRQVALKLVHPELLFFPGARERFRREVAVIARLEDPGIVPIHTVGEVDGIPYFAMEYVVGANLAEILETFRHRDPTSLRGSDLRNLLLERTGRTSSDDTDLFLGSWPDTCTRIVQRMALAAHHAHERGVLHRDLKPSNAMITPRGRVLLLDFGLASAEGTSSLTRSGAVVGTLHYMAPEQVRGEPLDARSEVYSLAATLYELLTLTPPHDAASADALRSAILDRVPLSPRQRNREVDRDLARVVLIALDREPAHRYASAADFAADLGRCLEHRPIVARPPGLASRARRWVQRHPARAIATLILLVAGLGLMLLWRERDDAQRASRTHLDSALRAISSLVEQARDPRLTDVPGLDPVRERQLDDAMQLLERVRRESPDDPQIQHAMWAASSEVAELQTTLGKANEAMATADRALADIANANLAEAHAPDVAIAAAALYHARAGAKRQLGDIRASIQDLELALERLAGHRGPREGDAKDLRANCLVKLASLVTANGDFALARTHLAAARHIDDERLRESPTVRRTLDALVTQDTLSNILMKLGRLDEALAELDQVHERLADLRKAAPREPHLRSQALRNQVARANALRALGRTKESEALTTAAMAGFDELIAEYPDRITYAWSRSMLDYEAGQTAERAGNHEQASNSFRRAIERHRALLVAAPGHREYAAEAALFVTRVARIAQGADGGTADLEAHDVDTLLEDAIGWLAPLLEAAPSDRHWRATMIQLRNQLGRRRLDQQDARAAREHFRRLASLYELELADQGEHAQDRLVYALQMLTIAEASDDDPDAAMTTLTRLVDQLALPIAAIDEMGHELHLDERDDFVALRRRAKDR